MTRKSTSMKILTGILRTVVVVTMLLLNQSQATEPAQTWFCPTEPNYPGKSGPSDYWSLFTTTYSGQWQEARGHVQVFKIYPYFLANSSDTQLTILFTYLRNNGIALAIEWPFLTWSSVSNTGHGVEGYASAYVTTTYAQRIKNLGGDLAYAVMDEPVYYGHYYTGTNCQQAGVQELANSVADNIRQMRAIFPNVKIGQVEPIEAMPSADWAATMQQWFAAYKTAVGEPLAFFHVDVSWSKNWQINMPTLKNLLSPDGIKFGVIFNANNSESSDAQWMKNAEINIQRYNASGIGSPSHVVIQNWNSYPTTILPETSTTAYAYLVNYYFGPYATKAPPTLLYRLYHTVYQKHFYTANLAEKNGCVAAGWIAEGTSGAVYPGGQNAIQLVPLYRLYNASVNSHFYTVNESERANALLAGYVQEGVAGYVYADSSTGGVPLYRAYGGNRYGYLYTTDVNEYNGLGSAWSRDGICCYLP